MKAKLSRFGKIKSALAVVARNLRASVPSRSNLLLLSLALLFGWQSSPLSWAQITKPTSDQAPPVPGTGQHHVGTLNESVNPATGAVSIRIDAGVPAARGITV